MCIRDSANPVAQILSAAMMLKYSFGLNQAASAIENAVADALSSGIHTRDIAMETNRAVGTSAMGDAIADRITGS